MSKTHLGTGPFPPENGEEGGTGGLPRSVGVPTNGPEAEPPPRLSKPASLLTPENTLKAFIYSDCLQGVGENVSGTVTADGQCVPSVVDEVLVSRLQAFERFLIKVGRSKGTAESYRKSIVRCVKASGKDPLEWEAEDLKALMASPSWNNWSLSTRNLAKAALVAYWRTNEVAAPKYLEWDMMRGSKFNGTSQRTEDLRAQAPSQVEVDKVRAYCRLVVLEGTDPSEVYSAFITLLVANYGLRCVDTASMRVQDIRLDDNVIHIPLGKGQKARDVHMDIPLDRTLLQSFMSARASLLRSLKERYASEGHVFTKLCLLEEARADTPLFFCRGNQKGDPTEGDLSKSIQLLVPRMVSLALGRHINAHAFRHAKAFELLDKGIPIETVAQYLGHANIQQTMEYRWAEVEAQRSAFARINPGVSEGVRAPQTPSASSGASKVSEAIAALASLQASGALSVEAFAAAVAAVSK